APSAQEAYDRVRAERARDFWSTESNARTFNRLDMQVISNATTWNINDDLLIKNIVGYRYFDRDDSIDFDGLPLQVLEVRHPDTGHEFSEELQMQGKAAGGTLDWVTGLYYAGQIIHRRSSQIVLAAPQVDAPWVDTDNKTYAAFAQATWHVPAVEGLSLTGGLRYTRDERRQENRSISSDPDVCVLTSGGEALPADDCALRGAANYDEPTYSVSLDYKLDRGTLVYLAHRRGYRSGGFDYAATNSEAFGPFKPEFVTDFELGVKKDWRFGDSLLRTNIAAYTQDYKDIQRFITRPDQPAVGVTNAASATINGGELELTFVPFEGLSLSGFYGLVFAEYHDFATGEGDFSNNDFAQAPREQLSLSGDWRLPFDLRYGQVHFRADWYHQTRAYYTDTAQGPDYGPADSQYQKAYGLVNLSLAWNSVMQSNFDLSLYARNVAGTETKPFGVMLYRSLGYNISSIGDPRVIGLELNYRFNL
ncbi:MAG: TonB-dependent receptor, partial [Solimonas sp.]